MLRHNRANKQKAQLLLELNDLTYSYQAGAAPLLGQISLSLPPGAFYFLTGPSGAGKTTFLKLCYGALRPTSGTVTFLGRSLGEMDRDEIAFSRRRIGVVHQDCRFLDHLSLRENVALPLTVTGTKAQGDDDLEDLLHWVGLTERAHARPPELSGGERQRAALARAVITSPDLILADEPTGNIDQEMSQRLMTLLIELNRMGKTILIATHDLSLIRTAKQYVQARVLRLSGGTIQLAGADL